MAEIMATTLSPNIVDLLTPWLSRQRWYSGIGTAALKNVGGYRLDDPAGEVGIEVLFLADHSGGARGATTEPGEPAGEPVVYQVPLTYRSAPLVGGEHALIGTTQHGILGTRYVYDGPHDHVCATAIFELALGRVQAQHARISHTPEPRVQGGHPDDAQVTVTGSRVLRGEQSNTSIIFDLAVGAATDWPPQAICKLFRTLSPGANPDVVLTEAIWRATADQSQPPAVPRLLGYITGPCGSTSAGAPEASDAQRSADQGHLALVQEFLPDTQDAWRTAVQACREGVDFTDSARALGAVTARVHTVLAQTMPTVQADEAERAQLLAQWQARAAEALELAPELAAHAQGIEAVFTAAAQGAWPRLQRVHGDLHLGQVLDVPGRGWVLLDFEGEPLRPLAQRTAPDLALRDVAGVVRSFDYVAGTVAGAESGSQAAQAARAWARAATSAFLDGYYEHTDAHYPNLFTALLLDKALYEVSYERRNRPTWAYLPLAAVQNLVTTPRT